MISGQACQPTWVVGGAISTDFPAGVPVGDLSIRRGHVAAFGQKTSSAGPGDGVDDAESLEDTARREREYVKGRVREELGREPTEEEVDEWVREHTEGY